MKTSYDEISELPNLDIDCQDFVSDVFECYMTHPGSKLMYTTEERLNVDKVFVVTVAIDARRCIAFKIKTNDTNDFENVAKWLQFLTKGCDDGK